MSAGSVLAHRIDGEGEPVLLLNGGMMTFPSWEPVASRLRGGFRTLLCDFRGQLLSPGVPPPDLGGHARDVLALLDEAGWQETHVVGASFGAEVAIELAATAPERVRSLVLVTAMDRATEHFREGTGEMREALAVVRAGGERERFYDLLVRGVYSERYRREQSATLAERRAQVGRLPLEWFDAVDGLLRAIQDFDQSALLPLVRCPVLVVAAGEDTVMDRERTEALAEALGAELAVHPTSGHALVAEDPEWLGGVCLDFLSRHDAVPDSKEGA